MSVPNTNFSTYGYNACENVTRSPITRNGYAFSSWMKSKIPSSGYGAIGLKSLGNVANERGGNAPGRDLGYAMYVVEHRPVFQLPEETTQQSTNVQSIWQKQLTASQSLDFDRDQMYSSTDYTIYCTDK